LTIVTHFHERYGPYDTAVSHGIGNKTIKISVSAGVKPAIEIALLTVLYGNIVETTNSYLGKATE